MPDSVFNYERLQTAVESAGIGTWDFNPITGDLQWSVRCKELFGLPPTAEMTYQRFLEGVHPNDRDETNRVVEQALNPRGNGTYDIVYRTVGLEDGGQLRWVRATGQAFFDDAHTRALRFVGTVTDITEQKLREQEYRTALESIPPMVWITDPQGFHTYFNKRWIDYTGYTVAESQGTEMWNNLLHPDDQEHARKVWGKSLATGSNYEIEYRFKGRDGKYRWFLGLAKPMRDEQGQIVQWFGTCTDIHDQKQAEETLRWSEERYQMASLATKDAIWDWNLETSHVGWNEAIHQQFGYQPGQVVPTADWWYQQIHPDDAARVVAGIHAVIDGGGKMWQDNYRYRRADGTYAHVYDRGYVAHNADGKPVRMIGAMQDMSEYYTTLETLKEREAQFAALADHMAQLAWMTGPDGQITWYNKRWYDYTGTSAEEMLGSGWHQVHHPAYIDGVKERFEAAIQGGTAWEDTFPLRGHDGQYRWFLSRAIPIRDEQGQVLRWFGTNTDVTEQKKLQDQLERSYQDLEAKITFRTLELEHEVQELRQRLSQQPAQ